MEAQDIDVSEAVEVKASFDRMGLKEDLLRGIYAYGFEKPSAIQQRAIVPIVSGRDLIAQSQSGTVSVGRQVRWTAGCSSTGRPRQCLRSDGRTLSKHGAVPALSALRCAACSGVEPQHPRRQAWRCGASLALTPPFRRRCLPPPLLAAATSAGQDGRVLYRDPPSAGHVEQQHAGTGAVPDA